MPPKVGYPAGISASWLTAFSLLLPYVFGDVSENPRVVFLNRDDWHGRHRNQWHL